MAPESARSRAFAAVEQIRRSAERIPADATAEERLDDVESHESSTAVTSA